MQRRRQLGRAVEVEPEPAIVDAEPRARVAAGPSSAATGAPPRPDAHVPAGPPTRTGSSPRRARPTSSRADPRRSPELFADVVDDLRVQVLDDALRARWIVYWKQNPIAAWTGRHQRAWFRIDDGRFRLDLDVAPELAEIGRASCRERVYACV